MEIYQTVFLYSLYTIFFLNFLVIFGLSTLAPILFKEFKNIYANIYRIIVNIFL